MHIRYEEAFDEPDEEPLETNADDPRTKLKRIPLGEDWRLDFGGESRGRWVSRSNADFGQSDETQNAQQQYRWFVHANLKFRDLVRFFVQGAFNHVEDQDGPFQPTQENHGDLQQLFVDLRVLGREIPLNLRLGRQELSYGAYRLVGPLDWVSNRRRFDAAKLVYRLEHWQLDAFYAKPVVVHRNSRDEWNEEFDFYGLYATYTGVPRHGIDLYLFAVDRTEDTMNPNGNVGDQSVYTVGSRFFGRMGPWDYDTELSGQWGHWAGDRVEAWSWALDGGYTFSDVSMEPRIGVGFEFASGDEDPRDGVVGTFNQLFPFDHQCIGMQDFVGRQNLTRAYIGLDVHPIVDRLKFSVVFLGYKLSEERDALYNAGGVPILRDSTGRSGTKIGRELDLWIEWKLTPNSTVSFGYSHFWDGRFVHDNVRGDDDPDMFLIEYRYQF